MANGIKTPVSIKFREGSRVRKHLKKAGGHIGRNVVEIKMKTIVRKTLMIKISMFVTIVKTDFMNSIRT